MSKNYYFELKEKPVVTLNIKGKVADNIINKMDETIEKLMIIHIGQSTNGWQPLFQANEYYSSVNEIKQFYNENKDILKIVDEYGIEYMWEELYDNLMDKDKYKDLAGRGEYNDSEGYCFARYDFE